MNYGDDWSIRRHRPRPRAIGLTRAAAIGLGVVGLVAAVIVAADALGIHTAVTQDPELPSWQLPPQVQTALVQPTPTTPSTPTPATSTPPADLPTSIKIPAISVSTTLEALTLDAGDHLRPPGYNDAGWYAAGTKPGDVGPAVIVGHYDTPTPQAPSVFYRLDKLKSGDLVEIQRGAKVVTFTVDLVESFPQSNFPTSLVYGPTPTAQLRLITCGGSFDTKAASYVDNVVVFATETP